MSAAPHITNSGAAPISQSTAPQRPKRITPPEHWQRRVPVVQTSKKQKTAATATTPATRMSRPLFGMILGMVMIVLNLLLFWLAPLPETIARSPKIRPTLASPLPDAEADANLPIWLRP